MAEKTKAGDPLTARQAQVMRVIVSHYARHGFGPSIRDVMRAIGSTSPNGALCHLRPLVKKNLIRMADNGRARGIMPVALLPKVRAAAEEVLKELGA